MSTDRLRRLAMLREHGHLIIILHFVIGVVVLTAVGPRATDDPNERSQSADSLYVLGQLSPPFRPNHSKIADAHSGRGFPIPANESVHMSSSRIR